MRLIGRILYLGPHTVVTDFDSGLQSTAAFLTGLQQLEEAPNVALMSYDSDPFIVVPEAIGVRDLRTDEGNDLLFEDAGNNYHVPEYVFWTGWSNGRERVFMAPISGCYDAETQRCLGDKRWEAMADVTQVLILPGRDTRILAPGDLTPKEAAKLSKWLELIAVDA